MTTWSVAGPGLQEVAFGAVLHVSGRDAADLERACGSYTVQQIMLFVAVVLTIGVKLYRRTLD